MPADDGLHGMSAEDLATFLHGLRALREREGLGLDGTGLPLGRGPRRGRWRPGAGTGRHHGEWPWSWPGWPPGASC